MADNASMRHGRREDFDDLATALLSLEGALAHAHSDDPGELAEIPGKLYTAQRSITRLSFAILRNPDERPGFAKYHNDFADIASRLEPVVYDVQYNAACLGTKGLVSLTTRVVPQLNEITQMATRLRAIWKSPDVANCR